MDKRTALATGTLLDFPELRCCITSEVGRGSNALVYRAWYVDHHNADERHDVLIKELFPLHPGGGIYRAEDGSIICLPEGESTYAIHRRSFEEGNTVHLDLLRKHPDEIGSNLNTYALNGTLYTVLGFNGGRSMNEELMGPAISLRPLVERIIKVLDALEAFHDSGLLHLDIAPDNIMLLGRGQRERVMLIDYNSCQRMDAATDGSAIFSVKAGYTAPEIRSRFYRDIGPRSDLYSVAAVLFRGITGEALTPFQMIRPLPPDVSHCQCMSGVPETVQSWTQTILRRGLCALPSKRYQSVREMREDLLELLDRIDGVGITHWVLWEAGWRNVERMIRDNPSLAFMKDPESIYPACAERDGALLPMAMHLENLMSPEGESALLIAGGGMGKTTALLRTAYSQIRKYTPTQPAISYLSLYGWQAGERDYILNRLLETLRFKAETRSFEDARKTLLEMLDQPLPTPRGPGPLLILMLDGLNEVTGETGPLIDEITRLSRMKGVRVLAATRSDEPALPFQRLRLAALQDDDVQAALSRAGLLMPESPEMCALLRTPLMLSIFIQSSLAEQKQLSVSTRDELMGAFFRALLEKEIQSQPENAEARWQTDAAMRFVLPTLARELHRRGRALTDAELLPAVEKCFKLFNARILRRAFPQWIGRSEAIRGGAENGEVWYGQIVHDILWKRLGLLLRDDQGRYQVSHQFIEAHLLAMDRDNVRRIVRRRQIKAALIACVLVAIFACGYGAYGRWIKPRPYDETLADNVMDRAATAYSAAGTQYARLKALTDCAIETPDDFKSQYLIYEGSVIVPALPVAKMAVILQKLTYSGAVMPSSGKPLDTDNALILTGLYEERRDEYDEYARWLTFVMTDAQANSHYSTKYPKLLSELLEIDADICATLYQIAIEPHVAGKYADGSATAENYEGLIALSVAQNAHLTDVDNLGTLKRNLNNLYGARVQKKNEILACGVKRLFS